MARQGFFNLGPLANSQPSAPARRVSSVGSGCEACLRYEKCGSPKMAHTGEGRKRILVVIEVPTKQDDARGHLLSGDSGTVLYDMLESAELTLKDCWVVPAVRCFGEEPTGTDVQNCRILLHKTIQELQPAVIVPMGVWAIQAVLGEKLEGRLSSVQPSAIIGFPIPDRDRNAWIVPTASLQHMVGADRKRDLKVIYRKQFAKVKAHLGKPFPEIPTDYKCAYTVDEACEWLREIIRTAELVAFDYETTGLKPQKNGHRITTAAVAWYREGKPFAVAFPFFMDKVFRALWRKLMTTESIGKVAHNNSFEDTWTFWRANMEGIPPYWVKGWKGDTCLQAHCLSNRAPTGLKWEVAWRYGVFGYDMAVEPYIKSPKADGANGFNRMGQVTPSIVLPYNAQDALYSLVIHTQQRDEMLEMQKVGADFFVDAVSHLARASSAGLNLDPERTDATYKELTVQLSHDELDLRNMKECSIIPGFNHASNKQLATLLYDKLKYPEHPELGRGVDEEALEAIGTPFTSQLLKIRQNKKLRDTYLEGFRRESVGGVLRTFFHLHKVDTFRGSSSEPNFQNIPKRNKHAQKVTRSVFRPSPGNRIIEWDYKAVEVCISACYHKDPAMIRYIEDPATDMHRDTAFGLFCRGPEDFTKDERGIAKNGFVFPSFYGSVGENMANGLWVQLPDSTKDHLASKGISGLPDFKRHVIEYEKEFWEVRFRVYNEWRNAIWADYQRKGYIDLYTGFRMYGPLKRTQATNGQIQGSAFHCLLRTLSKAAPEIEAISGRSRIIGQIHDAMVGDIHPDDEAEADRIIKYYGTEEIRKHWDWIIVPLTIEKDRSEIDGSWAEMKSCGAL